jgi:hypothetical protein
MVSIISRSLSSIMPSAFHQGLKVIIAFILTFIGCVGSERNIDLLALFQLLARRNRENDPCYRIQRAYGRQEKEQFSLGLIAH